MYIIISANLWYYVTFDNQNHSLCIRKYLLLHSYLSTHSNEITCRMPQTGKWREESSRLLFRYLFYWARRDLDAPISYLQYTMYEMWSSEPPSYEAHLCKRSRCCFPRLLTRQSNQTKQKGNNKEGQKRILSTVDLIFDSN